MEAAKDLSIGAAIGAGGTIASSAIVSGLGFTSSGVAAGSVAAGIQAGMGNVAAGSAFAVLQSLGATGAILTSAPVIAVGGAIIGGGYWLLKK